MRGECTERALPIGEATPGLEPPEIASWLN